MFLVALLFAQFIQLTDVQFARATETKTETKTETNAETSAGAELKAKSGSQVSGNATFVETSRGLKVSYKLTGLPQDKTLGFQSTIRWQFKTGH